MTNTATAPTHTPPNFPAYCDPANEFRGERFERGMDVAEIAKRYRADIGAAIKAGTLPADFKVSVRVSRFAGGQSISCNIKVPGVALFRPEFITAIAADPQTAQRERYTDEFVALVKTLEAMLSAYNRDNSDTMTDYFDVNFYQHVQMCWEAEKVIRETAGTEMMS